MPSDSTGLTLVADPARTGLTIIPSSTPLTRLNYFDGKFLRADDLRLDQDYERLLVRLSTRGGGSGVVHGFELQQPSPGSDAAILRGGLALTPSGAVLYLPSDVPLSLTELLRKSGDTSFDPSAQPGNGGAAFAPCGTTAARPPDIVSAPQPAYVITLASEEALCGEEERFGELCSNACLTDTDRPRRVEGVRVLARRLDLSGLVTSTTVPFTGVHYRSRLATAYFAAEQQRVASLISGLGLSSSAWCSGAEAANGDEVPIAVLAVDGTTFAFIDLWTARRELMVEPARRYWAMRMAMRSWDVFLAQILQFQCQLRDLPTSGGNGGTDPCAGERTALRNLRDVLQEISPKLETDERTLARYRLLAEDASRLLAVPGTPSSGSLLVDHGFVTTPSAGYLPVDPTGDVPAQVRAQFGPGVDLRFCVADADVVPSLVEQAQHLERISLTAGLDDAARKPPVDVIIPDGTLASGPATTAPAYLGTLQIVPRTRLSGAAAESGSALNLSAAGRDDSSSGWTWAIAAFGLADDRVGVQRLALQFVGPLLREREAEYRVPIIPNTVHDERVPVEQLTQYANRERAMAGARRMQMTATSLSDTAEGIAHRLPDRPIAAGEGRPIAIWADLDLSAPVSTAAVGTVIVGSSRLAAYSRAATNPFLGYLKLDGTVRITDRRTETVANGQTQTVVDTVVAGTVDPLVVTDTVQDAPAQSVSIRLQWRFGADTTGRPALLAIEQGDSRQTPFFEANQPTPDSRRAVLGTIGGESGIKVAAEWQPPPLATAGGANVLALASGQQVDGGLDPGSNGRDLAEAAIEAIGAELSLPDRDPQFAERARALMFPDTGSGRQTITARRDWVMFTRRRTVQCGDLVAPAVVRHYRAYHATVDNAEELERFNRLISLYVRNAGELVDTEGLSASTKAALARRTSLRYVPSRAAVDDLGFVLVDTVDFAEGGDTITSPLDRLRTAWSSAERGATLAWSGAGDAGPGDGPGVVRRRVVSYRAALSGLIDTSSAPAPVVLSEVPDEFLGVGTDGAVFTVGVRAQATVTQLAVRMNQAQYKEILAQLRQAAGSWDRVTEDLVRSVGQAHDLTDADFRPVQFDGTTLSDAVKQDVTNWWQQRFNEPPEEGAALVESGANLDDETARATEVLTVLGGGGVRLQTEQIGEVASGNAVVLLGAAG